MDTIGKSLRSMVEFNIDVLYNNDSIVVVGWLIAKEKLDGSTEYKIICMDTAREKAFTIYSKYDIKIPWQQVSNHTYKNTVIIQPFTVAGVEAGDVSDYKDQAAEAKLNKWLSSQPGVNTIFLNPLVENIAVECMGNSEFSPIKIPMDKIPKLTMKDVKQK